MSYIRTVLLWMLAMLCCTALQAQQSFPLHSPIPEDGDRNAELNSLVSCLGYTYGELFEIRYSKNADLSGGWTVRLSNRPDAYLEHVDEEGTTYYWQVYQYTTATGRFEPVSPVWSFTTKTSRPAVPGDVNGDGKADDQDIDALVDAYLRQRPTSATDINGDGRLMLNDLTMLISIVHPKGLFHEGHEYVDLGLPSGTLWATCNLGAEVPEAVGGFYAWGETVAKETFGWDNYKWSGGMKPTSSDHTLSKYCDRDSYGPADGRMSLEAADDVARQQWGGSWHIPTDAEVQELMDYCQWEWIRRDDTRGYLVTAPNGNSIFMPARQSSFEYWTSSLRPKSHGTNANHLTRSSGQPQLYGGLRYEGKNVRPVVSELKPIVYNEVAPASYLGHALVDLGLPSGTLWATCNLGASQPHDYGCYYAWGETTGSCDGKSNYREETYRFFHNGDNSSITKYNCQPQRGYNGMVDSLTVLEPADDAAAQLWQGEWRTPTWTQMTELKNTKYTRWQWTTRNGVPGYEVTSIVSGYEGNSIFLPAAGEYSATSVYRRDEQGHYWSASIDPDNESSYAMLLYFHADSKGGGTGVLSREQGRSIRPVVLIRAINN